MKEEKEPRTVSPLLVEFGDGEGQADLIQQAWHVLRLRCPDAPGDVFTKQETLREAQQREREAQGTVRGPSHEAE